MRETIERLVKGDHPKGQALSAGTDGSLYSSAGHVYLLFPVPFHSRDQMITAVLLRNILALKRHSVLNSGAQMEVTMLLAFQST